MSDPETDSAAGDPPAETMRIARYLARCGVASRRKAEEIVAAGRITLNGQAVTDLGRQVDPARDDVRLDGHPVRFRERHVTLMLNKPAEVLVSRGDTHGRRTVFALLPPKHARLAARLVYVGRLDYRSEGLLLMTTDGELAHRLAHPARHVEKEYHVWTQWPLREEELRRLVEGVELDDGPARALAAEALVPKSRPPGYRIVLAEGRKRQVRRMIEAAGGRVVRLVRVRMGGLELGDLGPGEWRELGPKDLERLESGPAAPQQPGKVGT